MKKKRFVFALSGTLLCYAVFLFFSPLYYSTDSLMAALIVDGFFSPTNNISQFQHPLFCFVVKLLTPLLPTADVFTMLLHLTTAFGFYATLYFGSARLEQKKNWRVEDYVFVTILFLTVFFLSAGVNIWNNNYTITAGAFVFMGLVVTFPHHDDAPRPTPAQTISSLFLIAMGIMLRRESALLFIPFVILDLIANVIDCPAVWKYILRRYAPCLIVFVILLTSRAVLYNIEPYATASRYNDARTAIMDFPMKGARDAGIDPIDYHAALDWGFADTDVMNVDMLEKIATAGEKNAYPLTWNGLQDVLKKIALDLFHTNLYMSILIGIIAILLLRNLLISPLWLKLESILGVLGAFIIMAYFTFRGRAPMRVWEPVLFSTTYVLIRAAIQPQDDAKLRPATPDEIGEPSKRWRGTVETVTMFLLAIALWFSAGQIMAYAVPNEKIQTTLTARINVDDDEYEPSFDSLFIWPNWHGTIPRYFEHKGTLPSQRVIDHNIALGDWTYGQPYYSDYLIRIGAENPIKALVEGNAYIMGNGLEQYLQKHYGEDIRLVPTEIEVDERTAYRVERGQAE